ncbi:MAG: fibrobacter succinogenes major paralogous domain-containing protein [Chitinophagaceae bacterium]|jgi:uncharacterized protein (TIGR02145 family)|nr:fibrobacter succinogenes major paralogous domain-containing protein [Chitinophagaceae bacterium]MBK8301668.1 fibrobacter succinogenes major paralogous domain-containing protein [Chitinophagaceae bacterium]MBK9661265.1 fibrobacter succinogenes major paralogous domain-containing protein [Chitinophagaceae bacterium]MBK9938865.1 fibrobacter succinogenes major paralogous domain-containing protein [Chitinophagaceae bacterium]MBL0069716.1 fibrobacter succinogenes major paralogous domain-containing 
MKKSTLNFILVMLLIASSTTFSYAQETVTIGKQTWMKKNLDVSRYRNGDVIPEVADLSTWVNLTTGAWCYYENKSDNGTTYGKLYNWYAVNDPRGLAPAGWHIPSDAEWTSLITFLNGTSVAGTAMKETGTSLWKSPNTGATNSSGWAGLPGGARYDNGLFQSMGFSGSWWSSTSQDAIAWYREMVFNFGGIARNFYVKRGGFSVRCVRD